MVSKLRIWINPSSGDTIHAVRHLGAVDERGGVDEQGGGGINSRSNCNDDNDNDHPSENITWPLPHREDEEQQHHQQQQQKQGVTVLLHPEELSHRLLPSNNNDIGSSSLSTSSSSSPLRASPPPLSTSASTSTSTVAPSFSIDNKVSNNNIAAAHSSRGGMLTTTTKSRRLHGFPSMAETLTDASDTHNNVALQQQQQHVQDAAVDDGATTKTPIDELINMNMDFLADAYATICAESIAALIMEAKRSAVTEDKSPSSSSSSSDGKQNHQAVITSEDSSHEVERNRSNNVNTDKDEQRILNSPSSPSSSSDGGKHIIRSEDSSHAISSSSSKQQLQWCSRQGGKRLVQPSQSHPTTQTTEDEPGDGGDNQGDGNVVATTGDGGSAAAAAAAAAGGGSSSAPQSPQSDTTTTNDTNSSQQHEQHVDSFARSAAYIVNDTTSLPQLQNIRCRLKQLLDRVELRIENELEKKKKKGLDEAEAGGDGDGANDDANTVGKKEASYGILTSTTSLPEQAKTRASSSDDNKRPMDMNVKAVEAASARKRRKLLLASSRASQLSTCRAANNVQSPIRQLQQQEEALEPAVVARAASASQQQQQHEQYPMDQIVQPGPNDVLFGRGLPEIRRQPGNRRYQKLIQDSTPKYSKLAATQQQFAVMELIKRWRVMNDPPGRFLKRHEQTKLWYGVGDEYVREKTTQAFNQVAQVVAQLARPPPPPPPPPVVVVRAPERGSIPPARPPPPPVVVVAHAPERGSIPPPHQQQQPARENCWANYHIGNVQAILEEANGPSPRVADSDARFNSNSNQSANAVEAVPGPSPMIADPTAARQNLNHTMDTPTNQLGLAASPAHATFVHNSWHNKPVLHNPPPAPPVQNHPSHSIQLPSGPAVLPAPRDFNWDLYAEQHLGEALKLVGPGQMEDSPPLNHALHVFTIRKHGELGFSICMDDKTSSITRICSVQPGSRASAYGLQNDDILLPPTMRTTMFRQCHSITRGWFLNKCQKLPLSFQVFRKYGRDPTIDSVLRETCPDPNILRSINYSVHRFVIHEPDEPRGFSIVEKTFGSIKLSLVSSVERNSLAAIQYGIKEKDIICRPHTKGRELENVHEWMKRKMEQSDSGHSLIFEVVRIHKIRRNEVSLLHLSTPLAHANNHPPQHSHERALIHNHERISPYSGERRHFASTNPSQNSHERMQEGPPTVVQNDVVDLAEQDDTAEQRQTTLTPNQDMHLSVPTNQTPLSTGTPNQDMRDENKHHLSETTKQSSVLEEQPQTSVVTNLDIERASDTVEQPSDYIEKKHQAADMPNHYTQVVDDAVEGKPTEQQTQNTAVPNHSVQGVDDIAMQPSEPIEQQTQTTFAPPKHHPSDLTNQPSKSSDQQPPTVASNNDRQGDDDTTEQQLEPTEEQPQMTSITKHGIEDVDELTEQPSESIDQHNQITVVPNHDIEASNTPEQRSPEPTEQQNEAPLTPKVGETAKLPSSPSEQQLETTAYDGIEAINICIQAIVPTEHQQRSFEPSEIIQGFVSATKQPTEAANRVFETTELQSQAADTPNNDIQGISDGPEDGMSEPSTHPEPAGHLHRSATPDHDVRGISNGNPYKVGTKVSKLFMDDETNKLRPFKGKVKGYDPEEGLYKILYEDGDVEEIYEEEVREIVVHKKKKTAPLLTGTLSFAEQDGVRRHLLQGQWEFDKSSPQSFDLVRDLAPDEDLEILPMSGIFHGSFVFENQVGTSNLKTTEIINENDVELSFVAKKEGLFSVKGKGTNRFGLFKLHGTARKNSTADPSYNVRLRKKYITSVKHHG